jgi:UDP-N-acetylmuramoylalanine--D-glutamate ligase
MTSTWRGRKVVIIGLGIEGEDMARYFVSHGARVSVSAMDAQARRVQAMGALGVRVFLGANDPRDVEGADLVCVSQGVPLDNAAVQRARISGIPVESMTSMFFDRYPGPLIGITGSSGKTTTTSLVDAIFTAAGREHVLGGNIGQGLLRQLDSASLSVPAVLEVSHTQLQLTRRSPHIAALLNVTPNHLDQFTWDEYVALKRRIFDMQTPRDSVVFNLDDAVSAGFRLEAHGRIFLFSLNGDHGHDGAYVSESTVFWRREGRLERALNVSEIPLRGRHNVANVAAATAIAAAADVGPVAVSQAVRAFKAPPHRLEVVARTGGVTYINDSIATAPERTLAALKSFTEPVVLMLGGRDKHLPLEDMLVEAETKCRAIVCFGESRRVLADAVRAINVTIGEADTLQEAFVEAKSLARPGDVVLLSPACTSFDAYPNFEARGEEFRALVGRLPQEDA